MARSVTNSWRWWLRPPAIVILLGSLVAASYGAASGFTTITFLVTASLLPLLWPRRFGSWRALFLLLFAVVTTALATAARWPHLETTQPELAAAVLLWATALWTMLPVTLGLLLWRRLAGIPIMLLGMAAAPLASLLLLMLNQQGSLDANSDAQDMAGIMRLFAAATPIWFVTWACCLGPVFFFGSFAWLLYREGTRGIDKTKAAIASSPATVADAPHRLGKPDPDGS